MFQRDTILRMIQDLTEMIATVSDLKKQQKQELAFSEIDDLLGRYFRMNSKLLNALSDKDLLSMFSTNGFLEAEKVLALARILKEEGLLHESLGDDEEAVRRYRKGLLLALGVSELEEQPSDMGKETVQELHETLKNYELPVSLLERLLGHYVSARQFAAAEDCLFDLAEQSEDGPAASIGERFYAGLLDRNPEELEQGGLPFDEVAEGKAAFEARYGKA
ncbi:DUF6483 family protein [Gorillibacterium sp. sgz500922]|uniref:DUF6483 family protein n=1 Tax=Gorillibacterium sp. sgz500922 TaxID=3446694 RepID=UPI003F67702A